MERGAWEFGEGVVLIEMEGRSMWIFCGWVGGYISRKGR